MTSIKNRVYQLMLVLVLLATSVMTVVAQEEGLAEEAVDGNTRGIMMLVLLLGFGTIALIGFYVSATEGQDNQESES
jgi:hypothetical protein